MHSLCRPARQVSCERRRPLSVCVPGNVYQRERHHRAVARWSRVHCRERRHRHTFQRKQGADMPATQRCQGPRESTCNYLTRPKHPRRFKVGTVLFDGGVAVLL
jgi:hypothetical protein